MNELQKKETLRRAKKGLSKSLLNLPEIGKKYNCFDDGKISESRRYEVEIISITPLSEIHDTTKSIWVKDKLDCDFLYKQTTDFFITGINEDGRKEVFVRTIDDGWFSIGLYLSCGRLDVDGKLTERMNFNKNY